MDFRKFVQNSLNPHLHVTFLKTSVAGLLDMAQGTDDTSTDHKWCPDTVTAQILTGCKSTSVYILRNTVCQKLMCDMIPHSSEQ